MKNIRIFKAFSLAEALITLLIVCLITLASVPIITKKKRNLENISHGLWMCALNSAGNYVVYDSNDPVGNVDNPDTWSELPVGTTSCRFNPPMDAKNVSVTLIGGGGAGASGISELEPILDNLNPVFRPTETSFYRVTLIGGGGGGAHGVHRSNQGGSGGAAGGFFVGNITLPAFYTYGFVLGHGGARGPNISDDQSSEPWSESGEATKFYISTVDGNKDLIIAHGGGGGRARTCKNHYIKGWICGGGHPSTGGDVELKNVTNFSYEMVGATYTGQGAPGTNTKQTDTSDPVYTTGGMGTTVLVNGVEQTYGSGGRGVWHSKANNAEAGHNGYFSLDKFNLFGGLGGEAALPSEYTFPKINGYLQFTIGRGGTATAERSTAGQPTELEYFNRNKQVIGRYYGAGGAAGGINTDYTSTAGANSYWTKTGGGAIGTCQEGQNASVSWYSQTAFVETGKCKMMLGVGAERSTTPNTEVQKSYQDSQLDYPKFMNQMFGGYHSNRPSSCSYINSDVSSSRNTRPSYQVGYKGNSLTTFEQTHVNNGVNTIFVFSQVWQGNTYVNRYCGHMWYCSKAKAQEALKDLYCGDGDETSDQCTNASVEDLVCMFKISDQDALQTKINALPTEVTTESELSNYRSKVNTIINEIKTNKTGTSNTYKYLTYWTENPSTNEHGFKYECLLPEYKTVNVPYGVYNVETPPSCSLSARGVSFGAGGGGGVVNENYVGSAGIGGEGAHGAVIVKW